MIRPCCHPRYRSDCPACRAGNAAWQRRRRREIGYGRWKPFEDATGTRRRIGALMWNGWSMGQIGARLGWERKNLRIVLHDRPRVSPQTAAKVRALYDDLWDQPPPQETKFEKGAASKARKYARAHGFVPPLAWDDDPGPHCIDDPAAVPAPSWDTEPAPPRQPSSGSPAIGAVIRQARQRAGMSQRALAAAVGVTECCVQLWEGAKRTPREESWIQLELTLGPLGVVRDGDPQAAAGDGQQRQGEAA